MSVKWLIRILAMAPLMLMISFLLVDRMMPETYKPSNLAKHLAVARYRTQHPSASPEKLNEIFRNYPGGMEGLNHIMNTKNRGAGDDPLLHLGESPAGAALEKPGMPLQKDGHQIDPQKIQYIKSMMVPEDVRQAIMENYLRTGAMMDLNQARDPATKSAKQ